MGAAEEIRAAHRESTYQREGITEEDVARRVVRELVTDVLDAGVYSVLDLPNLHVLLINLICMRVVGTLRSDCRTMRVTP
jgi:hypothetical protein